MISAQLPLHFDGATYMPLLDQARLTEQCRRVYRLMADRQWRALAEIEASTGDPQASISARLRDLRKSRNGSLTVERRRRGLAERGLFEYRIGGGQ